MKYMLGYCDDEECEEGPSFNFCRDRIKCSKFSIINVDAIYDPGITYVVAESDWGENSFMTGKRLAEDMKEEAEKEGLTLEQYMSGLALRKIIDYVPENMQEGVFYEIEGGVIIATKKENGEILEYTI